jgi:MSHA pilin protein MshD
MNRRRVHGFTLIELIFFIVVVSVGLTGILSVSNTIVKSSADPLVRKQALAIAQSLMEEIVLKDYDKPLDSTAQGFPAGLRNQFDCVKDFDGYVTTTGIVDVTGSAVAGLAGYNIAPAVAVSDPTTLPGSPNVPVRKIVVSVTGPQGVVSLTGYRGAY